MVPWINNAECGLSVLSRQALKKRFTTKQEEKGVDWQFTTKDARTKLKKLYPTVSA